MPIVVPTNSPLAPSYQKFGSSHDQYYFCSMAALHSRKWFGCRNQIILVGLFGWEVWLTEFVVPINIWLLQAGFILIIFTNVN
jgi:hypothetical protein